ncbi:type II CRISPR RNA-guided endonuclease Cas9 [Betaproteobacteria bacterium PRO5]|nr:type II CRISPR RNA-guided endonuclease Cas9 [Betaproteobacteria bacterium PRO5]
MLGKHYNKKNLMPLTFGLDIGIASVGWAVLAPDRIVDLGVRTFDKAETAKEGESLNKVRRDARLMRRRLQHRAWRLTKLARLLKQEGLISDARLFKKQQSFSQSLWQLRVEGLTRLLDKEEWARVIYHLCKHRGFHWISRAEEAAAENDSKGEGGKVRQGLTKTSQLMKEKNYQTAAEMVLAEFPEAQRNKQGDYGKALSRSLLAEELKILFECQRHLGNSHAGTTLETRILGNGDKKSGLFWQQKPALAGDALLKMLGNCTFEKTEYRAPKASFTAERHVWLTRLNNLRIVVDGKTRPLNQEERTVVLNLPYQQAGDFTYKQLRNVLVKNGLVDSFRFPGLSYPSEKQQAEANVKNPEDEKLIRLPAWQALRKKLKEKELEAAWRQISTAALEGQPELLDQIARVLSVYKEDEEITRELQKLDLPDKDDVIEALREVSFREFHALSLKALYKIVPFMETGLRYDQSCEAAGYHHSQLYKTGEYEYKYLPPFYAGRDRDGRMLFNKKLDMDIPRNPVVLRALNQARKVVNALIRTYGSPHSVHIEMARDLSKSFDERKKIEKAQDEFRKRNEQDKAGFAAEFNIIGTPKSKEFEKYQLYREQQGKCAYSLEPLDINRLFEPGYVEVDHALPYSRSFDDSKSNRVLVLSRENRNKGNKTPYEYLNGISNDERWRRFEVFVNTNKLYRSAKRNRLLKKDFDEKDAEDFRDRNLNDTRYICRFFKNYVERYLQLHEESQDKRCVVVSGQLTAFLRARCGLIKLREESDRHHALDAAVVAVCSRGMVKRLSDYSRHRELDQVRTGFVDVETGEIVNLAMLQKLEAHFPNPWPHFRDELILRLKEDNPELLRKGVEKFGTYPPEALEALKPLFVSRAPQRRNGGAAHKDTIYGQPERLRTEGNVVQKVPLDSLTLDNMNKLIDPHRNEKLYSAIRARLEQHNGKGNKAFPPDNPLRKPGRHGNPDGPIVRSVKLVNKLSGIPVRGGIAKNDTMLRVDIFTKAGKFHLVPIYVHHKVAGELPNRAIIAFKDESEWTLINDSFSFCCSLHPNDLVRINLKKESQFGYYAGCDRSTGAISLWAHDRNQQAGKDGLIRGIGAKTALSIEKFHVDVLGRVYPAPPEKRRGLA